jgi:hypothetical protein
MSVITIAAGIIKTGDRNAVGYGYASDLWNHGALAVSSAIIYGL